MECPEDQCFGLAPHEQCDHWRWTEAQRRRFRDGGKSAAAGAARSARWWRDYDARTAPYTRATPRDREEHVLLLDDERGARRSRDERVLMIDTTLDIDARGRRADGKHFDARLCAWI